MHPYIVEYLKKKNIRFLGRLTRAQPVDGMFNSREGNVIKASGTSLFETERGQYLLYFRMEDERLTCPAIYVPREEGVHQITFEKENYSIEENIDPDDLALRIAVENEEYEKAAIIRDIINRKLQKDIEKLIEE